MKLNIQLFADTEVSIKFNNKITNDKDLEKYAETLTRINSVLSGINSGVIKELDKSATSISGIDKNISDMSNKVGVAFNVTAISKFAGAIKKLGAGFTALAKQSFDYLENFNLFQVAFEGNYTNAEKFVNKLTEMYGLDESWLTKTAGHFKQLSNAMGLTAETGEKVSQLLTQMSLDISSLYNVDIERAASTLSSAMAGQTKPIRGVAGGDITQATLQTTLDKLDIDTTVNKLSFAEKRLLIIISLTDQLKGSINDMGRTIESPANQLRIMNEQWERLSRAVGNVFLPILSKVLPYLNAILMVLTEIISTFATFVRTIFGMDDSDFDYFDEASVNLDNFSNSAKSAGASAKKLRQGLRGFDKLNNITTPNKGSSGAGGGGGIGGMNPKLLGAFNDAFAEYQKKLTNVNMLATQIRDKIMDWLGFTKHVNEETDDVYFTLDKGVNRFKVLVGLIGTLAGFKLLKGLGGLITGTSKLGQLLGTGGLYNTIKKLIDAMKVLGAKDGLMYVFYDSKIGKGLTALTGGFGKLAAALGLSSGALLGIVAAIVAVGAAFVHAYKNNEEFRASVENLIKSIRDILIPVIENIKQGLKMIWEEVLVPIWEQVLKPLANLLYSIIVPVLKSIIDSLTKIYNKIIKPLMPYLEKISKVLLVSLVTQMKIIIAVIQTLITILQWLWDNILEPIFTGTINALVDIAVDIINKIIEPIKKVIDKLEEFWHNWLEPIYIFLKAYVLLVIYSIKEAFDSLKKTWDDIKKKFKEVWEEYVQPRIDKIKEAIDKVKKAWQDLKDKWKLPDLKLPKLPKIKLAITYDTNVGKAKQAVYKALGLDGWPRLKFESYALGGLPQAGQMFIANERGPELVGQIGGQSFVANQNQVVDLLDRKLGNSKGQPINATFVIQVGNREVAKQVINDLQDLARTNGKPITIGG